jgi:predicted nucleotidyltransferase
MNRAETNSTTTGSSFLDFSPLPEARVASLKIREELDALLIKEVGKYTSEDTSLVVFGSLARGEWTSGSDLDWTYLIDGQANSDHLRIAQKIHNVLRDRFTEPGQTGTFGNMAFSHEIIHQIGGQNDTNKNTTQRILLLLESTPIGKRTQAYDRVIWGVINRYLDEDTHLLSRDSTRYRVPRFLLNDIVRFWRTMAVDFASKQKGSRRGGLGATQRQAPNVSKVDLRLWIARLFRRHLGSGPEERDFHWEIHRRQCYKVESCELYQEVRNAHSSRGF